MSHSLFRLLNSVYNVPHLAEPSALRPIVEYLQSRSVGDIVMSATVVPDAKRPQPEKVGGVGELKVDGILTYKPVVGACGDVSGVSYQGILNDAQSLIAQGVDTIVMTHSSPGGQAAHCFTTAIDLRAMCDEAGVKLITYIDTQSSSAALALGVVADEVYIHPSAYTGSIGCVCALMDVSKAMANAGLKPIYIASTPGKTGMNDDGSFSEGFLATLQDDVTRLGNQFAEHVSKYTGIDIETITAMDAKTFTADAAVEAGLANGVMDHRQFADYLTQKEQS